MNDPKKRNALSLAMLTSLQENILTGIDDKDLRVIIISGRFYLVQLGMQPLLWKIIFFRFCNAALRQ